MRILVIIFIFFSVSSFENQNTEGKIESKKIVKLLCNEWNYEYSIKSGLKEVISKQTFTYGPTNVYFRIDFRKMKKNELDRFYKNCHVDYKKLLEGNILEGIEMFGDFMGCPEYPILLNDSIDGKGDLIQSKIESIGGCMGNITPTVWHTFNIEKLTKDTLIISAYMGESIENKIVYSRK